MPVKDPIRTLDRNGNPGRPASVRRTAERTLAETLAIQLSSTGMVACAMPKKLVNGFSARVAAQLVDELGRADLVIVPVSVLQELALLVGAMKPEPGPEATRAEGDETETETTRAEGDEDVPTETAGSGSDSLQA